jgi:hydrogenase expression/formation protein HypD
MGIEEYRPLAAKYRVPIVVTGFEPVDILQGIYQCIQQLEEGRERSGKRLRARRAPARATQRPGTS